MQIILYFFVYQYLNNLNSSECRSVYSCVFFETNVRKERYYR